MSLDSAIEGMKLSIPAYRRQHIEANERALLTGWDLLPANSHPAWQRSEAHIRAVRPFPSENGWIAATNRCTRTETTGAG